MFGGPAAMHQMAMMGGAPLGGYPGAPGPRGSPGYPGYVSICIFHLASFSPKDH